MFRNEISELVLLRLSVLKIFFDFILQNPPVFYVFPDTISQILEAGFT